MSKASIYRNIAKEYDKDQARAYAILIKRKDQVNTRCPRIGEIDDQLAIAGIKLTKLLLSKQADGRTFIQTSVETIRKENETLLAERERLLSENGFPIDFFTSVYKCFVCKDTGYADGKPCQCFRQRLITQVYAMSNLGDVLGYENFDMFDFRYYSDKPYPNEKLPPREKMRQIYSTCLRFVEEFGKDFINLLFYGSSGLGKTFLCHCIAKELLDMGKTVVYVTAFELFKMIEHDRFHRDEMEAAQDKFLELPLTADLLIIDDLGTEFSTVLSSAELFHMLNQRLITQKPTVISTNLLPKDLINQYSDRIVSRVYGNYKMLNFYGDDIRVLRKHADL